MTDSDTQPSADRPLRSPIGDGGAETASLAREAFFGRVSLDRMIDRFFDGGDAA